MANTRRMWLSPQHVELLDQILKRDVLPLLSDGIWMEVATELIVYSGHFDKMDAREVLVAYLRHYLPHNDARRTIA